ncbi:MAG: hypothetical protein AB8C46_18805 [Burkholderiaceae bacterium]
MTIISNFELLLKPIAPPGGPAAEVARVAVQGYFIQISNLETRDITFVLRTRTSVAAAADGVNTEFTPTNHAVVYDITQDNDFQTTLVDAGALIPNKQNGHFVSCIRLPAGKSASLAILPNVAGLHSANTTDLAIRGYSEIALSGELDSLSPLTFSAPEVSRILVSCDHRTTYLDPEFDPADFGTQTGLDFDQTVYGLPTANGQALQILDTYANFNAPFHDLIASNSLSPRITTQVSLVELGAALTKRSVATERTTTIKVGRTPLTLKYAINKGKVMVNEDSLASAVKRLKRRKKLPASTSAKTVKSKLESALGGSKKAAADLEKLLSKMD